MKKLSPFILMLCLMAIGCQDVQHQHAQQEKVIEALRDSLQESFNQLAMSSNIYTFLTFQKEDAEQAMNLYIELFDNSEIVDLKRWGKEAPGKEGTIMQATFTLNGKLFMCSDSPPVHEWDFTPAVSNFVICEDENQQKTLFSRLSEEGKVMMPLGNYGFSQQFGWVEDKFGISWQLNLE